MIKKYKNFGSKYFYRYICDDCGLPTEPQTSLGMFAYTYPRWLKFADGRTFCPECLKKRLELRTETWPAFYRAENELTNETGIDAKKGRSVLYRLWQLRGVFPEATMSYKGKNWIVDTDREEAMIAIQDDGRMTFTTTFGPVCQFT